MVGEKVYHKYHIDVLNRMIQWVEVLRTKEEID